MEDRKTIFQYLNQVFCIFGITMLLLVVFSVIFGENAKEFSTMFALGNEGIPVKTMAQFFLTSVLLVGFRILFFTEGIIKNMDILTRTACMLCSALVTTAGFVYFCSWFPFFMWQAWLGFFICFGICFAVSLFIMRWQEKMENRKMEEGLKRMKEKLEDADGKSILQR